MHHKSNALLSLHSQWFCSWQLLPLINVCNALSTLYLPLSGASPLCTMLCTLCSCFSATLPHSYPLYTLLFLCMFTIADASPVAALANEIFALLHMSLVFLLCLMCVLCILHSGCDLCCVQHAPDGSYIPIPADTSSTIKPSSQHSISQYTPTLYHSLSLQSSLQSARYGC